MDEHGQRWHEDEVYRPQPERRRRQHNPWATLVVWLSVAGWILFSIALGLIHDARPEMSTGLVRYHGIAIRTYWRADLTLWIEWLLWANCGLSLLALIINRLRMRRKTDRHFFNLWLLVAMSLALLLLLSGVKFE